MALTNRRITSFAQSVSSLDDKPKLTAAALKAAFDSNSNELKPAINGMIDDLTGPTGAGEIGTSPIEGVTGTDVQTMLEFLKGLIDLRDPATEVDRKLALKADTATVAAMVKSVGFNAQTGVFTITEQGGTVHEIDTALEKVPVSCRLDGQDFVLTLEDGTEQRASLGAFLTPQEFANSDTVQFEVAGNTIRAKIKSGSINADMLTGTILEELTAFRDAASRSAQNAAASEQNAAAYKTAAAGSAQEAGEKAAESGGQAANARSWAAGGTGTRAGEDTDNAKYYRDQARLSATQAGEKAGAASADAARAEAAARGMGVHIGADLPGNSEKIWLKPVDDPLIMNPNRATADMTQEVAVDDDGRLVTKPTTMQGTLPPPTTGDAGKVPVVNADATGYDLIFCGSELLADVTISGQQELHIRSIDYESGVMELTEPLTIGSDGASLPGGFGGWGLGVDITKLQSLKNSVPKELLQKFGSYFSTTKRMDETHIQITDFSSLTEPSDLDLDAFWIAKSAMVTLTDLPEFERLRFHVSTNGGTCSYIRLYDEKNSVIFGYCAVQSSTYGSYNTRIPAVSASGLGVSEGVLDGNSTLVLSGRSLGFNAAGSFVSTVAEQNYAVFDRERKVKKIEIRAEYGQMLNGSRVRVWKEA